MGWAWQSVIKLLPTPHPSSSRPHATTACVYLYHLLHCLLSHRIEVFFKEGLSASSLTLYLLVIPIVCLGLLKTDRHSGDHVGRLVCLHLYKCVLYVALLQVGLLPKELVMEARGWLVLVLMAAEYSGFARNGVWRVLLAMLVFLDCLPHCHYFWNTGDFSLLHVGKVSLACIHSATHSNCWGYFSLPYDLLFLTTCVLIMCCVCWSCDMCADHVMSVLIMWSTCVDHVMCIEPVVHVLITDVYWSHDTCADHVVCACWSCAVCAVVWCVCVCVAAIKGIRWAHLISVDFAETKLFVRVDVPGPAYTLLLVHTSLRHLCELLAGLFGHGGLSFSHSREDQWYLLGVIAPNSDAHSGVSQGYPCFFVCPAASPTYKLAVAAKLTFTVIVLFLLTLRQVCLTESCETFSSIVATVYVLQVWELPFLGHCVVENGNSPDSSTAFHYGVQYVSSVKHSREGCWMPSIVQHNLQVPLFAVITCCHLASSQTKATAVTYTKSSLVFLLLGTVVSIPLAPVCTCLDLPCFSQTRATLPYLF